MSASAGRLADKVCVTTGAGGAFAGAVADRLTSEDATVVGVDRHEHSVGAHCLQHDLTDEDQVQELFARVTQDFGSPGGRSSIRRRSWR